MLCSLHRSSTTRSSASRRARNSLRAAVFTCADAAARRAGLNLVWAIPVSTGPDSHTNHRRTRRAPLRARSPAERIMGHRSAEEEKGDVLRLSRALQSGTGHVAVIALDRATARAELRKALVRVEAAAVLHVSATGVESPADVVAAGSDENAARARVRSLMAPLLAQARAVQKPAFIVVDDADAADGAALERIRIAVECAPDAIPWLRIVLVGGEALERVLSDPAASALTSRLCARVRVTPAPAAPAPAYASTPLRVAALTAFGVAFISLGAWSYL